MTMITFIRHGVTAWNKEFRAQGHTDNSLDEEGFRQARALATRFSRERESWDVLYCSDLLRARQTAAAILETTGIPDVRYDARIREIHCGQIEGTTEPERLAKWGADWRTIDLGIETTEACMERGSGFVRAIADAHPGRRILVVSHGTFIRNTLQALIPDYDTSAHLDNTSVSTIVHDGSAWSCELYNCYRHLAEGESKLA